MSERTTRFFGGTDAPALSGYRLDSVVTVLSLLMIAGVALDFRAHAAGISFEEEGFLTPEHAFFYSMFLGIAAVIGTRTYQRRRAGATWIEAVPPGYAAGVGGVILFGFGGVGDFFWHSTFGFEEGIEGLTSPSHLMLATGAALFLASPARAVWAREGEPPAPVGYAVAVSVGLVLTVVALFTLYVNPVIEVFMAGDTYAARMGGMAGQIVFTTTLLGGALALVRRFDLPAGALTLCFLLPAGASAVAGSNFLLVVPVLSAGLVADAFAQRWALDGTNPLALRAFGACVPLTFAAGYAVTVEAVHGIAWTVHVWTGAIVVSVLVGLLVTYIAVPMAGGR